MPDNRPVQAKPSYPIPWIATYFVAGLILIAGSFVLVWYVSQFSSEYDYSDPDMAFLERIVLSPDPQRADFSALNGGDWQALCLVGWLGNPAKAMAGAKLPRSSATAIMDEYSALANGVERSEFVIIYVDKSGAAKALKHPHGFAFAGEGRAACTIAGQPVLAIPVGG